MNQKKIYILVMTGLLIQSSLYSMDMDRVNTLAAQFAGKTIEVQAPVVQTVKTTTEVVTAPVVETVAPVAKVEEPAIAEKLPAIEEAKTEITDTVTLETITENTTKTVVATGTVSEESLGLRKTNLYEENGDTVGESTSYGKAAAGSSTRFQRAFENAPPMIPHDVEGMLPIKIGNNACTGCHLPEVAPSMKATPIPKSHFTSFRPITGMATDGKITKEGKEVDNTSDFKTVAHGLGKLSGARFNCSQCHAPQSTQAPLVGNTFTPEFSENGAKSSNLIDTINIGVK